MAEVTHEGTGAHEHGAGFPPFKTETFPGQIFWLAITFAFLFVMLWRVAGPRIKGAIHIRREAINGDIRAAEAARAESEAAGAAYQNALATARKRAQAMAEETRVALNAEIATGKADAEAEAGRLTAAADARINESRAAARGYVKGATEAAAIAIVAKLTGETVSAADAAAALEKA